MAMVMMASYVMAQNTPAENTGNAIWVPDECPECDPVIIIKEVIKEVEKLVPVVIPLGTKRATGDAVEPDVLEGKTFSNKDNVGITGTMTNNGAMTFNPGATDQTVPAGYHNGSGTVVGDPSLFPGNIKSGATIFGVTGTSIESSGTATPAHVLTGQTFSNAFGPATGTMPNIGQQNITPSTVNQSINPGYHDGTGIVDGDATLVTGNIRSGVSIFGVAGDPYVVNTSTGDAVEGEMLSGKKAWVDGNEVTGTLPTQILSNTTTTVQGGYYVGTDLATVDNALIASNICQGITIFGITGTNLCTYVETATGRLWMPINLGASQVATSSKDSAAYGDLYQWGRLKDGHEKRASPTTTTLSSGDVPGHRRFIKTSVSPNDWRDSQNDNLWQGVSGINNPCPDGFRLPTSAEFMAEVATWSSRKAAGAFSSPLKLTVTGYRDRRTATVYSVGNQAYYKTATVSGTKTYSLRIRATDAKLVLDVRAYGDPVRCILD
jgi:uncharacterized protein (TIGR02145 family)